MENGPEDISKLHVLLNNCYYLLGIVKAIMCCNIHYVQWS